jgi:hypothetical protein
MARSYLGHRAEEKDMKVRNLDGAMQNKKNGGSWLAHWEKCSGQIAFLCSVKDCISRPTVGGHVQKDNETDQNWYIVPLCDDCRKNVGKDLDIWDLAPLIAAGEPEAPEVSAPTPRNFTRWILDQFPARRLV